MVNADRNHSHEEREKTHKEKKEVLPVSSPDTAVNDLTVHIKVSYTDSTSVAVLGTFALVDLTGVADLLLFAGAH